MPIPACAVHKWHVASRGSRLGRDNLDQSHSRTTAEDHVVSAKVQRCILWEGFLFLGRIS